MPGFPTLSDEEVDALVEYLRTGRRPRASRRATPAIAMKYRFTGYKKFLDPDGYPAIAPPWGTLTAINLDTGAHAWQVPLGEYPKLAAAGLTDTGSENYGGPIVTAGGLVFIGATCFDKKLRAFDKATGERLWEATLPFSAVGTPATYEVGRPPVRRGPRRRRQGRRSEWRSVRRLRAAALGSDVGDAVDLDQRVPGDPARGRDRRAHARLRHRSGRGRPRSSPRSP